MKREILYIFKVKDCYKNELELTTCSKRFAGFILEDYNGYMKVRLNGSRAIVIIPQNYIEWMAPALINIKKRENFKMNKPERCIDPIMKYCQTCKYGYVHYPEWAKTFEDLEWAEIEEGCIWGLENTEVTKEELEDFNKWFKETFK